MKHSISWWPPKVGDILRYETRHSAGGCRVKTVEAKLHVVSVFDDKNNDTRIVTAEWFPTKRRWSYEVRSVFEAMSGLIWRDGARGKGVTP